ncbi:MAG: AAA-like domain-containing protein [Cyanobium sp.]
MPISAFLSYSHKDEVLRQELVTALSTLQRTGAIECWHDRRIIPGQEWEPQISEQLLSAELILLLISSDFIASDFCYQIELEQAMERHSRDEARVIPILLRPVDWKGTPFARLQILPSDAVPVTNWASRDAAYLDIAQGIRRAIADLNNTIASASAVDDSTCRLTDNAKGVTAALPPETPEGPVPLQSPFYMPSPLEPRCFAELESAGALISIKAPSRMGKTSLLVRLLARAEAMGQRCVSLNLLDLNQSALQTPLSFMQAFCTALLRELEVRRRIVDVWDASLGPNDNTNDLVRELLLQTGDRASVLAIDNCDRLFGHPEIAAEFFSLLRAWHERARTKAPWGQLRLVIVYSQEPYLIQDINQSPFNVGLPIELDAFTAAQQMELSQRHGLAFTPVQEHQFWELTGGHPYLVRAGLYQLSAGEQPFEAFLRTAPTEAGCFSDHLRHLLGLLVAQPRMAEAFSAVINANRPVRVRAEEAFQLDSLGLVTRVENDVQLRCSLYRRYFQDRWQRPA